METIKLAKPLKVNGKELTELKCDVESITVDGFARAEAKSKEKRGGTGSSALELDYTMQLYLGFEGIIAADSSIDLSDLERIGGKDLAKVMAAGRFFFIDSEADSTEESSEAASESTPTNSTAARSK